MGQAHAQLQDAMARDMLMEGLPLTGVPQLAQWLMKAESLMMMRGCLMRPRGGDLEDHLLPVRSNL